MENKSAAAGGVPPWGRPLGLAAAAVFFISLIFPVSAALVRDTAAFPAWWGPLDVGLAFVLATLAILVSALGRGRVDGEIERRTYRLYRVLIHVIIALILVFFLAGDRLIWTYFLPGIAWRAWLLLYTLPEWLALVRNGAHGKVSP